MTVDTRELVWLKEGLAMCSRSVAMRLRAVLSSTTTWGCLGLGVGVGFWEDYNYGLGLSAVVVVQPRHLGVRAQRSVCWASSVQALGPTLCKLGH